MTIRLLGEPRLFGPDGQPISLPTTKTLAVLAMILSSGQQGISRQAIGERLWSRSQEQQARTNLRQALSALRKALGPLAEQIVQNGDALSIRRGNFHLDIDLPRRASSELGADDLATLLDSGEFLEGIAINETPFDEWLREQRTRLARQIQECLEQACEDRLKAGDNSAAERISHKLISLDNFNEAAHRFRMRALAERGEVAVALKHFEELRQLLETELSVAPGAATTDLAADLKTAGPISETPGEFPASPRRAQEPYRRASPDQKVPSELRNVVVVAVDIAEPDMPDFDISTHFDALETASEEISKILRDFKGTELANNGASFLAVFGHPVAHSKDGERGLRFASAVMTYARREMPTASIRAAMVSGVVLANSGKGAGVLGDPIRRAQALIFRTPAEEIVADRGVYRATGGIAQYAMVEDDLWRLVQMPDGPPSPENSSFVGRDRELRQVVELLEDIAEERRGEVIVLRGEAGIGKTRLGQEIAEHAQTLGYGVSNCRVLDFGQGRTGNSLGMIATALLPQAPSGLNRIESAVWKQMVRPDDLSEVEHQAIRELDQNSLLQEQTSILTKLANAVTETSPVLLIVEDVHWAHPNVMKGLGDLAAYTDSLPMILLLTTRPENDPIDRGWRIRAGNTRTTTIDLQPLRRQAAIKLAQNIRDLDEDLLKLCLERANGNPLFIEQLVLWAEDQSNASLPLSVQSVVQERLDRVPLGTRRMAQAASVLGQVFDDAALEAVFGGPVNSADDLNDAHLVVRRDKTFTFAHALVRDGIYASISPRDRRDFHLRAASHFEAGDRVLAARHIYWSGDSEASSVCYKVASEEHQTGRLDTALELVHLALDGCDDAVLIARCQLLLGEALRDRETYAEAAKTFLSIKTEDEYIRIRSLVGAAESHFRIDHQDETMRLLEQAESIIPAENAAFWETTIACLRAGVAFSRSRKDENIEYARKAIQASEQLNDKPLRARALSTMGDAEMMAGLFLSSESHFRECIAICKEVGLQRYALTNQVMVPQIRFYDAEPDEAEAMMLAVLEEAQLINFARPQMLAYNMLYHIQTVRAEYAEAERFWRYSRDMIEASSAKRFLMNSACGAASFLGPLGRIEELMTYLSEAEAVADELGLVWILSLVYATRALWIDNPEEASRILDSADEIVFSGKTTYPFDYYYVAIDAALKLEDWQRAELYADRLDAFFKKEPVGLQKFLSAKARACSAAGQERGDEDEIKKLIAFADEKRLIAARGWLEAALRRSAP
ncbi:MAG: BTAD domain-containing putative transcriptional regulator [Arenibacterium sp.]